MDYVIKKLNNYIDISDHNSIERQTLLRERVEYILFILLGVLWNKNLDRISAEKRRSVVENLYRISIGQVVEAIRALDFNNEIISKKQLKTLDKYPSLRNQRFGHGYSHEDVVDDIEKALDDLYNELIDFSFLGESYDIIEVKQISANDCEGIRYSDSQNGAPTKWICHKELINTNITEDDVLLMDGKCNYYRITPFVYVCDRGESVYVFCSLEEKLTGRVSLNRLFRSDIKTIYTEELIYLAHDSERRRISANGTIMNYFDRNYNNYINTPIEKDIKEFLLKNRSNVQATVWGHGGVGKTACIQNVCMELFNDRKNEFSYIIFVSAKDRKIDTITGKLTTVDGGIRTYLEILDGIIAVVYDREDNSDITEKENIICNNTGRTLIVIDDYETFEDSEKGKIQRLINRLNIDNFKVLITTRNKRFSSGIEIKMDEFDIDETKRFIEDIFEKEYKSLSTSIHKVLKDGHTLKKIFEATSGRALFLYQFAQLFAQKGLDEGSILELKNSKDAREFLYGRLYDYLGKTAQKEFMTISQIVDEKELIFKDELLFFVLNKEDMEDLEYGLQELVEQKIIEKYDAENYRVYSNEMVQRMEELYKNSEDAFKDYITNRLHSIGGKKRIKGTVYDAMLEEANASRYKGNVKDTLQKYRQILNDKNCEKRIKKKALLNLTSYININLTDNEQTIKVFDDYVNRLEFQNDVDIINMYVQYLWRSDVVAKEKACDILDRLFRNNPKLKKNNLDLFAVATNYLCHNVLENTPEKVKEPAENRIINEYGRVLFNHVSNTPLKEFKPRIRHNVSLALIATIKVALDLSQRGYDKKDFIKRISDYGTRNFNELFKNQLDKLEKREAGNLDGQTIEARVTYIARFGLLVEIKDIGKAIIHNDEMNYGQRDGIKIGDPVMAEVIGQNEKGYILSTKNLECIRIQ